MKKEISPAISATLEQNYHALALARARSKAEAETNRRGLIEQARQDGIGIVHIYEPSNLYGGLTIAFKKCSEYPSGVMVEVAVNTCSDLDIFNKRVGTEGALRKFYSGKTISLPILRNFSARDLNYAVKSLFEVLWSTSPRFLV